MLGKSRQVSEVAVLDRDTFPRPPAPPRSSAPRTRRSRRNRSTAHDRATSSLIGIDRRPSPLLRRPGYLITIVGLAGLLITVTSRFADALILPPWSQGAVAGASGMLLFLGVTQRREPAQRQIVHSKYPTDLPTLTGEIATVLSRLRLEHGLAYRSNTWVTEVLPRTGVPVEDAGLVRDLLAVCALDAGGVRADTAGLVAAHSRERLILAAMALLDGLHRVLSACEAAPGGAALQPSDPTRWPV